jgi:hypothetical protein
VGVADPLEQAPRNANATVSGSPIPKSMEKDDFMDASKGERLPKCGNAYFQGDPLEGLPLAS